MYSQTTRSMLQIRMICNFFCFCFAFAYAPAPCSSGTWFLTFHRAQSQALLASPQSMQAHSEDAHLPHHSVWAARFLFPTHDHLLCSFFLPASFSSVPLTADAPSLISLTPLYGSAYISQNCHPSSVVWNKWCSCASGNLEQLFLPLPKHTSLG